ncbi:MAG: HNH endonuclease [Candidatus Didemnitutus sp.]|nr:HNH endonuclease [Candidatus Didemnitutus sp.]
MKKLKKLAQATDPKWWDDGKKAVDPSNVNNWAAILKAYNYHCIYCKQDLTTTLDQVVGSTIDHVLPSWVLEGRANANRRPNLFPCCSVCNALKGPWVPELPTDPADPNSPWNNRKVYIRQAREHIAAVRTVRQADYGKFVGLGVKTLKIWNDPDLD